VIKFEIIVYCNLLIVPASVTSRKSDRLSVTVNDESLA